MELDDLMPAPNMHDEGVEDPARGDGERPNTARSTGGGEQVHEEAEILAEKWACIDDFDASRPPEAELMLECMQETEERRRNKEQRVVIDLERPLGVEQQQDTGPTHPRSALPEGCGEARLGAADEPMEFSVTAWTASKATGGAVGRRRGSAQHNRPKKSRPSKTGISKLDGDYVVECFGDDNKCRGVFKGAHRVNENFKGHLEKAHSYTREQLADPEVLKRFECPCLDCVQVGGAGSVKLVDPKTVFKHLAKSREPTPEEKLRLEGTVILERTVEKFSTVVSRIVDWGVKENLPPTLRAELALLMSEVSAASPEVLVKFGISLPTEAPPRPVTLSFAIKRTMNDKLEMVFACPKPCADYHKNGLRLARSYRDHHKDLCHPDNTSSFLRCIVSSKCTSRFERPLFTPSSLEKHLREGHEGLEELCKPGETARLGGRLAVLTKEALDLIGDRWADLAHKTEMGSPYRKSKDDEVYFFSSQVTCGDDGELVIQPGYSLGSSAEARLEAGEGVAGKKTRKKKKKNKSKATAGGAASASSCIPSKASTSTTQPAPAENTTAGGAAPEASLVSNHRSSNEENERQRGRAVAVVEGVGCGASGGEGGGDEDLSQGIRPRRGSLSRLSLRQRNGKSPARENPSKGSPQARARPASSLGRAKAASPRRDGVRSPARGARTYHTALDGIGSGSGATWSCSPKPVPAVSAATTVVDQATTPSTPQKAKRKKQVTSKSPPLAPPRKVQTQG